MKIGIIRETKVPEDNRVALTPTQIKKVQEIYPDTIFRVQSSNNRAYTDEEYRSLGIDVRDEIGDCDILLGIKEASIDSLLSHKHYFFFGHIAKLQAYNKPLLRALIEKKITFSDWEYLVDDADHRVIAFGWYAGVVGVYYTLQGWCKRSGLADLPKPDKHFSKERIISILKDINFGNLRILVTGKGRVSQGAQFVLDQIGAKKISCDEYLSPDKENEGMTYTVATIPDLVKPIEKGGKFDANDFHVNPEKYTADFSRFATVTDVFISCHFWKPTEPVYITKELCRQPDFGIKMIGDITCDINGSIESTIRSSTHDEPFYDYSPYTEKEEEAFSDPRNITVMAVDTCPNALPRETSNFFGNTFIANVLPSLFESKSDLINRATLVKEGSVNEPFDYLNDYLAKK